MQVDYLSCSLITDLPDGVAATFPWAYARREFVHLLDRATDAEVPFQWLGPASILPARGGSFILERRTPRPQGGTDFGHGGRLLKDSAYGEFALRQLHWVQEQAEAGIKRCLRLAVPPPPDAPSCWPGWGAHFGTGGAVVVDYPALGAYTIADNSGIAVARSGIAMSDVLILLLPGAYDLYIGHAFAPGGAAQIRVAGNSWSTQFPAGFSGTIAPGGSIISAGDATTTGQPTYDRVHVGYAAASSGVPPGVSVAPACGP